MLSRVLSVRTGSANCFSPSCFLPSGLVVTITYTGTPSTVAKVVHKTSWQEIMALNAPLHGLDIQETIHLHRRGYVVNGRCLAQIH